MSLRDTLRARLAPEPEPVVLPLDGTAFLAAERVLEIEQRTLQGLRLQGVEDLGAQEARVVAAQAALGEQQTFTVLLQQLDADAYDELVEAHPPTDEQRRLGWQWEKSPFRAALLAACAVTADGEPALTEKDWAEFAREKRVAAGELEMLFATAVNMHLRQPQVSTGKG